MVKQLQFKLMLLLCALMVGSGSAWADDVIVFEEDFSQFTASNTNALTSLSSGDYGDWSDVANVYKEIGYIKFSSSNKKGKMTTPALSSLDGDATLTFKLGKYSSKTGTLKITINNDGTIDSETSLTFSTQNISQNGWDDTYSIAIEGGTSETTITFESTNERFYLDDIKIVASSGSGSSLSDSDFALTDDPVALTFDLYNNANAQVIEYTTSSTGIVSIENNAYASFAIDHTAQTITVTPTSVTPSTQTITVNQAADDTYAAGSTTFTITITDSTPFAGGDITFTAGTDIGSTSSNNSADEVSKSVVTISSTDAAFATAQYRLYSGSTTTISASQGTITKIVFTKNSSYDLSNLSTETGTYTSNTGTWEGNATSVAFSAAAQVRLDKIVVTVETTTKNDPNLSFGETTTFIVNPNASFTAPTLTYATGFDGTVVYSSDNEDVALVDENTGVIVIGSVEGTATITAASAATDNYYAGSASYTINVIDSREEAGLAWSADRVNIDLDATSYTLPTLTNDNNVTVSYSSNNESVAVIDASTGETIVETSAIGTATITATFAGDASYKPATVSYVIKVIDPNANDGSIEKPYTVADIKAGVENTSGVYVKGFIVGNYNASAPITSGNSFTNTNLALADTPTETDGTKTIPVELTSSNSMRDTWGPSEKPYNIGVAQILVKGNVTNYFNVPGVKQSKDITKIAEQVSITAAGMATYYTDCALDFTDMDDIFAYTATVSDGAITFNRVRKVPAETGILLRNPNGKVAASQLVPVTDEPENVTSQFTGTLTDIAALASEDGDYVNYILNNGTQGVGFYKANGQSLGAHKAYLHVLSSAVSGARPFIGFNFNDEPTGISDIKNGQMKNMPIYNLSGQRITQPTKGLYIMNGKKVIVK